MCEIYGKNIIIFWGKSSVSFCCMHSLRIGRKRDALYAHRPRLPFQDLCTKDFSGVFKIQISFSKTLVATCCLSVSAPLQYDWEINPYKFKMNTQSVMRRHPHSFSIEQILAKPEVNAPSNYDGVLNESHTQSQLVHPESGRGTCDVSRVSSPATSSCLEDGLDDGKSDIDLASDDGSGVYRIGGNSC